MADPESLQGVMESLQYTPQLSGALMGLLVVYLAMIVLIVAATWKIFTKARQPGWTSLVPIVNLYVMLKIAQKPQWWLILMFVPIANLIVPALVIVAIAENFGKDSAFGIGMLLLPMVFMPILAFSNAEYLPVDENRRLDEEVEAMANWPNE